MVPIIRPEGPREMTVPERVRAAPPRVRVVPAMDTLVGSGSGALYEMVVVELELPVTRTTDPIVEGMFDKRTAGPPKVKVSPTATGFAGSEATGMVLDPKTKPAEPRETGVLEM